ncbi:MAG TPA: vitamin K epoxide reductase family protein [Solirubrobacterales bacterium]|jgi:uncharacterized membrane protein
MEAALKQLRAPAEATLQRASAFGAAFGIGIATYIALSAAAGDAPACIDGSHGCLTVAESSYSHLLGINVAVFGIAGYAVLLVVAMMRGDAARLTGFALGLIGFGFSVYLTYLELFAIDAICQWCVASAIVMTVVFAINTTRMMRYVGTET